MRYGIGVLILLWLFSIAVGWRNVVLMINGPALFIFLLVMVAIIIMKGGFKTYIAAVNALLSEKYVISAADKEKAIQLFRLLSKSMVYTAIWLTAIGAALILFHADWSVDSIGEVTYAFGINLIAVMYGAFFNLAFFYPAISILESRNNAEVKTVISEKQVIDKLLELSYKQGITPEEILEADEIAFRKKQ